MPHDTNRKAFASLDNKATFLRLYSLLVAVELSLKDKAGQYPMSHDLDALAQQALGTISAALQATLTNLTKAIGGLQCTYKGQGAPVSPAIYPGIRYVRHQADWGGSGTSDQDLEHALRQANAFVEELRRSGVSI